MQKVSFRETGQIGLFANRELLAGRCHLRFINVAVNASDLELVPRNDLLANHSVMNEIHEYKNVALGPG